MLHELLFYNRPNISDIKRWLKVRPKFEESLRNQLLLSLSKIYDEEKTEEDQQKLADLLITKYFQNYFMSQLHEKDFDDVELLNKDVSPIDNVTVFLKQEAYLVIKNYKQEHEWQLFTEGCLNPFFIGVIAVAFCFVAMSLAVLTAGITVLCSLLCHLAAIAFILALTCFIGATILAIDLGLTKLYHVCVETFLENKEASAPIAACVIFPPVPPITSVSVGYINVDASCQNLEASAPTTKAYTLFDNTENLKLRLDNLEYLTAQTPKP